MQRAVGELKKGTSSVLLKKANELSRITNSSSIVRENLNYQVVEKQTNNTWQIRELNYFDECLVKYFQKFSLNQNLAREIQNNVVEINRSIDIIIELKQDIKSLEEDNQLKKESLEFELENCKSQILEKDINIKYLKSEVNQAEDMNKSLTELNDLFIETNKKLSDRIIALTSSLTWKLSAPFREVVNIFKF